VRDAIRAEIPPMNTDRFLAPDIERVADLVRGGDLVAAAEAVAGRLA
jgi:histidine ammonia-lyase